MSAIPPRRSRQFVLSLLLALVAIFVVALAGASSAFAASSGEIKIVRDNATPQNSGAPTQYTINISCSGVVTVDCGEEPTIRIPLDLTNEPLNTPSMETWVYGVSSGITGLVASKAIEGGDLVIKLNAAKFIPGDSDTIQLSVTPPNGTTPNGTEWSLAPTLESTAFPVATAPVPATGAAKAEAKLSVSKNTADGGTVYVKGGLVTFNITAQCAPGGSTGNLFMENGSLVDPLPPGLKFIEASPTPSNTPGRPTRSNGTTPAPENCPPAAAKAAPAKPATRWSPKSSNRAPKKKRTKSPLKGRRSTKRKNTPAPR